MLEVKYVVMPITVEQKKEYHRQGFRVIDARFAPANALIEMPADGVERTVTIQGDTDKPARKARRNKSAEQPEE